MATQAQCWICKAPADSAEHRLKRSDLVRAYGKGPFTGPSAPVHVSGGTLSQIQGPRSSKIKYAQSLCHACNTFKTQPYDLAYDCLIGWILANEDTVLRKRMINFEDIYGSSWPERQRDLFKYYVKSFGCRLVDAEQTVPQELIDLLPLDTFRTALKITFSVNEDILLFDQPERTGFIGKGELTAWISKSDPSIVNGYNWSEHISWLTILYWYCQEPEGGLGSTWIADSQYVYLGSIAPLSPEERSDFLIKKSASKMGKGA